MTVEGNSFHDNHAVGSGGGLVARDSSGRIGDNDFFDNTAFDGGGVYVWAGSVAIEDNTVSDNQATTNDKTTHGAGSGGGGVFVYGGSSVVGNTIESNTSFYNGGGLFILQGTGLIADNTVVGNSCNEDGAGVYTNFSSNLFTGNHVEGNVSNSNGNHGFAFIGDDNVYRRNTARGNAGAVGTPPACVAPCSPDLCIYVGATGNTSNLDNYLPAAPCN